MFLQLFLVLLLQVSTFFPVHSASDFTLGNLTLSENGQLNYFDLTNHHHKSTEKSTLRFSIHGATFVGKIDDPQNLSNFTVQLSDHTSIEIDKLAEGGLNISEYRVIWRAAGPSLDREVCFHYGAGSWYSTYEEKQQHFPLDTNKTIIKGKSFTTSDFLQNEWVGNIVEHLFVSSDGFGLMLEEHHPWFIRRSPNAGDPILCFSVSNESPYQKLAKYDSGYFDMVLHVKTAQNIKTLWKSYINTGSVPEPMKLSVPSGIPDKEIFTHPIWSTWARYHVNIFQNRVLDFAAEINQNNFTHAQLEIDDRWEVHYGDLAFDHAKFPDAKKMIWQLHEQGFRVTIWTYPFINNNSAAWEANKAHYQVDAQGRPLVVHWWTGWGSPIDFTSDANVKWFVERLEKFKAETGVNSFKFDAGELNWYGKSFVTHNPAAQQYPNMLTTAYVEACAKLGGMIEVRAGYKSQHLPIFVRMMDKGSDWSWNNGLKTLIPSALTMSLAGYPFNLPDMIGGNGKPTEELLFRWIQANTFLPSMQFSVPPWSFGEKFVEIAKRYVKLHEAHAQTFIRLAEGTRRGEPIIRPMWFAEPEDSRTFRIADQFMVGRIWWWHRWSNRVNMNEPCTYLRALGWINMGRS